MEHGLKPHEIRDVENFLKTSPVAQLIREYRNWKFAVGDVLVKHNKTYDEGYELETVSSVCPIPRKFKVVHIDELNIPWVKQVSVRGGLGNKLYCVLNYHHPRVKWEVDPEQVEAILLGFKYDPRAEYKRMRTENPGYGGKKTDKE